MAGVQGDGERNVTRCGDGIMAKVKKQNRDDHIKQLSIHANHIFFITHLLWIKLPIVGLYI